MGTVLQKHPGSAPRQPSALILLRVCRPVVGSGRAAGAGCLHRHLCRLLVLEEATEGRLGRFDPGAAAGIWLCSFCAPANNLGAGPWPPVPDVGPATKPLALQGGPWGQAESCPSAVPKPGGSTGGFTPWGLGDYLGCGQC